ncbi:PTR2-domain-containing protein [Zopfia rhizophila CBS 207.26]|uniref:PTR2-domain-containing protein n=1 Tax=Zopfia rhizophila CBS 207.26 TaxID=1314779 RepID=A0A6A6EBX5_9PEZI|nr:PTR2-domain-containing protein [Zopfia rhizophila CBS 207.26]
MSAQTFSWGQIQNLRRVVDDIPRRLWVVAIIAFWERFTFWGITAPWQNYMENSWRSGQVPGALGMGQSMATRIYCAFYIFYYVTPLLFAVLSDVKLGRYKTLCISIILYVSGCIVLFMSSWPSVFFSHRKLGILGLAGSMVLIGLGGGGFKAIMIPFIADQYTETIPKLKILKTGERVVTDRMLTLQYIYNLYYWVGNVGSLSWFATTFLEKHIDFWAAYLLPSAALVVGMLMLFIGRKWYVRVPHEGNVLPKATKILLCASRNQFKMARADPQYQLEHREKAVSWSSQLVTELKRGLMACRVLISFVVFYICFDQMQNNLISQASQMESYHIPNDLLPAVNQVACIILGPLIQSWLYPFLHRRNIYFRPIVRITIGFAFISVSMVYATVVQHVIYSTGPCYEWPIQCLDAGWERKPNQVNVWIQAPVYVFIAFGEIFAYVTALEYAYDHSPTDMKVIVQAISLLIAGVGSASAMALTPIAHDPHLVILYACLASAMAITTAVFWITFNKYDQIYATYDDEEIMNIGMETR